MIVDMYMRSPDDARIRSAGIPLNRWEGIRPRLPVDLIETAARIPIGRNGDHIAAHDFGLMGDHSTLQTRVRRNNPLLSIARVHLLHNWFDLSGAGGLEILSRGIGGARRFEITPEREGSVPFWHNRILARSSSE